MENEQKQGFNAELTEKDLKQCCKGEADCGQCKGSACIIGYAKQCIGNYRKEPKKEIPRGTEHIPTTDFKVFDELELETGIAHILKECKNCREDHTENCIINVTRNCYEVGLLGDAHPFEGSALQYLMYLKTNYPEKAARIATIYQDKKN